MHNMFNVFVRQVASLFIISEQIENPPSFLQPKQNPPKKKHNASETILFLKHSFQHPLVSIAFVTFNAKMNHKQLCSTKAMGI